MRVHNAPKRSVEDVSESSELLLTSIDNSSVTDRCAQMAGYLRTLRGWASEEDNIRIGELLDAVCEQLSDIITSALISIGG